MTHEKTRPHDGAPHETRFMRLETDARDPKRKHSYNTKHKTEAALRILRGENIEALSYEYGVTIGRLLFWKETFLARGENGMHRCVETADDAVIERLKREIEWQRMKNEELGQELRRRGCTPIV